MAHKLNREDEKLVIFFDELIGRLRRPGAVLVPGRTQHGKATYCVEVGGTRNIVNNKAVALCLRLGLLDGKLGGTMRLKDGWSDHLRQLMAEAEVRSA